jgi:hypothetical protein
MTGNSNPKARPDAAAWWLSNASHFLHRYIAAPEPARLEALMGFLKQYREAVEAKQVEAPRFL